MPRTIRTYLYELCDYLPLLQVLHVIDSSYHVVSDMTNPTVPHLREKGKHEQKQDKVVGFMERISIVIQHIGISMINIHPQVGKIAKSHLLLRFHGAYSDYVHLLFLL